MGPEGGSLILVKLGGSLITDKRRPDTSRPDVILRLARELAACLPELRAGLLLGHGSGSFGHAAARRHGLGTTVVAPERRAGVAETQARAAALHRQVVEALAAEGVPVFSFAPSSALIAEEGRPASVPVEPVARALELGLVPLLYGDLVMDRRLGASILSTEQLLEAVGEGLAERGWRLVRAVWLGITDGIHGPDGATLPVIHAEDPETALHAAGGSDAPDVTGGMAHRLEVALRLARRGTPSWVVDGRKPGALERGLRGDPGAGTHVRPGSPGSAMPGSGAGH